MVAAEQEPGGHVIFRLAYDGQPYSGGEPIETVGRFVDLIRSLEERGEISQDLRAVLDEVG